MFTIFVARIYRLGWIAWDSIAHLMSKASHQPRSMTCETRAALLNVKREKMVSLQVPAGTPGAAQMMIAFIILHNPHRSAHAPMLPRRPLAARRIGDRLPSYYSAQSLRQDSTTSTRTLIAPHDVDTREVQTSWRRQQPRTSVGRSAIMSPGPCA